MFRQLCRLAFVTIVALGVTSCDGTSANDTSTSPTPIGPPGTSTPIRYTAIGASDANGVGSSVVCAPLASCEAGSGYVPVLARALRNGRDVTLLNLGIPGAVLGPAIQALARAQGRDVFANFIDQELPLVTGNSTLITIFGGGNDANAVAEAIARGAAGSDIKAYIEGQVRSFGSDYDRLVRGVRGRAPDAFIIVINLPNLAALPYAMGGSILQRQVLQQIAVGMSREANRQAGNGVAVLDLMCDPESYDPSAFSPDGFHPNDAGYGRLAQRLQEIVNGRVTSPPASCGQMTAVPAL